MSTNGAPGRPAPGADDLGELDDDFAELLELIEADDAAEHDGEDPDGDDPDGADAGPAAAPIPEGPWIDAVRAAALFAIDPVATGGVAVRALAGPVRERWLDTLRGFLPAGQPVRRLPLHVGDDRLLGGLDLAATLDAGRPVVERGLLAEVDGGILVMAMAERVQAGTVARLAAVLDRGEVLLERDGLTARSPARLGVVALDEGVHEDERLAPALLDRLAFQIDLTRLSIRDAEAMPLAADAVAAARARLAEVRISDEIVEALCQTALVLGVWSLRPSMLALRTARLAAALAGRDEVGAEDATLAGRLVLAPRATRLPAPPEDPDEPPPPEPPPEQDDNTDQDQDDPKDPDLDQPLSDQVLEAAKAAIPPGLLAELALAKAERTRQRSAGKAGALQQSTGRGRPIGSRRGDPKAGVRLNVIETLRAAAPWQPLRRRDRRRGLGIRGWLPMLLRQPAGGRRVEVRRDDFRITRFKQRSETTTIFVVDASGSAALHRLAEAKGAVELLLADCYVRRDQVALLAFRGRSAELLLPPTRSLVRAKRSLAGLPGGGGTPIAHGLDAAAALATDLRRRGQTPAVVILTDGRANVGRDGKGGRARAEQDAHAAARLLREVGVTALLIDVSPRPTPNAAKLAEEMAATYLPLPYADANTLSKAVRATTGAPAAGSGRG